MTHWHPEGARETSLKTAKRKMGGELLSGLRGPSTSPVSGGRVRQKDRSLHLCETVQHPGLTMQCVLVPQSCLTLCDPVDCSPPGSSVHGILQARILERAAMSSSRDLPEPGLNLGLPHEQADSLPSETVGKPYSVVPVFNRRGYWTAGIISFLTWRTQLRVPALWAPRSGPECEIMTCTVHALKAWVCMEGVHMRHCLYLLLNGSQSGLWLSLCVGGESRI